MEPVLLKNHKKWNKNVCNLSILNCLVVRKFYLLSTVEKCFVLSISVSSQFIPAICIDESVLFNFLFPGCLGTKILRAKKPSLENNGERFKPNQPNLLYQPFTLSGLGDFLLYLIVGPSGKVGSFFAAILQVSLFLVFFRPFNFDLKIPPGFLGCLFPIVRSTYYYWKIAESRRKWKCVLLLHKFKTCKICHSSK